MNNKLFFLLLIIISPIFAVAAVHWTPNTPLDGIVTNDSYEIGLYDEFGGTIESCIFQYSIGGLYVDNVTGTVAPDGLSCTYTPDINHRYFKWQHVIDGWAVINGTQKHQLDGQRSFNYRSCGYVDSTIGASDIIIENNFTATHNTCFVIRNNNINFDCNNYLTKYTGSEMGLVGIDVENKENVTLRNCKIENYSHGIYLYDAPNTIIFNSTISNVAQAGIYIWNSPEVELYSFSISNSGNNGIKLLNSERATIGNTNFVLNNITNISADGIAIENSPYVKINLTQIMNSNKGYSLKNSSNSEIYASFVISGNYGAHLEKSDNSVIRNVVILGETLGVLVNNSDFINISQAEIFYGGSGIKYLNSSYGYIFNNTIYNNAYYGISLYSSSNNIIRKNFVENHTQFGYYFYNSSYNELEDSEVANNYYNVLVGVLSNNNKLYNLSIHHAPINLAIWGDNNNISQSKIHDSEIGIEISHADHNNLEYIHAYNNINASISINFTSFGTNLYYINISNNSGYGILMDSVDETYMNYIAAEYNLGGGIHIKNSNHTRIENGIILANEYIGIYGENLIETELSNINFQYNSGDNTEALRFENSQYLLIKNLDFFNNSRSISLYNSSYIEIDEIYSNITALNSITISESQSILINNTNIFSSTNNCLNLKNSHNLFIQNVNIDTCNNGIWIEAISNANIQDLIIKNINENGIYSSNSEFLIFERGLIENSSNHGIWFDYGTNYSIVNEINSINNLGAGLKITDNSRNNTISNSIFNLNVLGILLQSEYNSFYNIETCENFENGIYLKNFSNYNTFNNFVSCFNGLYGILMNSSSSNNLTNISIHNNPLGIYMLYSGLNIINNSEIANTSFTAIEIYGGSENKIINTHLYNNNIDFNVSTLLNVINITLDRVLFDNPLGNYENYTSLSLTDVLMNLEGYKIHWIEPELPPYSGLPVNKTSFKNKFINISKTSGNPSIDVISWNWDSSEETEVNINTLELWKTNSFPSFWSKVSFGMLTPLERKITFYSLTPQSKYGLFINNSTPNIQIITPSNSFSYPITITINSTHPMSNAYFLLNGYNKSCNMNLDNTSCHYALNYSEHLFNHEYVINATAIIGGKEYTDNKIFQYFGCGNIIESGNYYIQGNMSIPANMTCLNISANNVYIGLNNYSMIFHIDGNCMFMEDDCSDSYGIYLENVDNVVLDFARIENSDVYHFYVNLNLYQFGKAGIFVLNSTNIGISAPAIYDIQHGYGVMIINSTIIPHNLTFGMVVTGNKNENLYLENSNVNTSFMVFFSSKNGNSMKMINSNFTSKNTWVGISYFNRDENKSMVLPVINYKVPIYLTGNRTINISNMDCNFTFEETPILNSFVSIDTNYLPEFSKPAEIRFNLHHSGIGYQSGYLKIFKLNNFTNSRATILNNGVNIGTVTTFELENEIAKFDVANFSSYTVVWSSIPAKGGGSGGNPPLPTEKDTEEQEKTMPLCLGAIALILIVVYFSMKKN